MDAFGLPSYRVFNFKKEINFIKNEKVNHQKRQDNLHNFALNKKGGVIIIAQTVNKPELRKVGLIPGVAAYRLMRIAGDDK